MTDLTPRESEVLRLAAGGMTNDEIADSLGISRRTVEAHMHTVFKKTGVSRRGQLTGIVDGEAADDPESTRRLARYDELVNRLVDRQMSLFEERVELTFTVGGSDDQDRVTERRWTTPRPYVLYRMFRPIVPADTGLDPDELRIACDVFGRDVRPEVLAVIQSDGQPRVMVLFQPGLAEETEWAVNYRSEGLWSPLRDTGADQFTWSTVTPERLHRSPLTDLAVRVLFPPDWTGASLAERNSLGTISGPARQPSGQQLVSWHDSDPTATFYEWELRGSPGQPPLRAA